MMWFTEWRKPRPMEAIICARVLGIQDIDIRRMRTVYNYDMVQVETWNRRKLLVSGMDIVRSTVTLARGRTDPWGQALVMLGA